MVHQSSLTVTSPRTEASPTIATRRARAWEGSQPVVSRLGRALSHVTVEHLLWALLIVLAAVSRFWDLSYRALMHDESIHTYYSWLLYRGDGYTHDPLSHGPFLFHATALSYFLFGDSDATSRFAPALVGVLLVATPWLLRAPNLLGRWGALAAGTMLLVSPSILYYTRFIRHDPFTLLGTLLLVVAIFRFLDRPQRRWLLLGGAMLALLYSNHEIVFALAALFVATITVSLLLTSLRPLLPAVIATAVIGALVFGLHRTGHLGGPFPAIPWDQSGVASPAPTPANQRHFYGQLLSDPFILALLAVVVLGLVGCWVLIRQHVGAAADEVDPETGTRRGWIAAMTANAPHGSWGAGLRHAWRDRTGLQLALLLLIVICAFLFTTFFTNLGGLATGTIATDGTLFYWLGQQGVRRGAQPWFYFLVMAPQYELLALAFGLPAILLTAWRTLRTLARRPVRDALAQDRQRFRLFVAVWAVGITLALSYAGEKMPWLIVHITLPLILLGATLIDELLSRWTSAHARTATAPRLATAPDRMPLATAHLVAAPEALAGENGTSGVGTGTAIGMTARTTHALPRHWWQPGRVRGRWLVPALTMAVLACGGAWLLLAAHLSSPRFVTTGTGASAVTRRVLSPDALGSWWHLVLPPLVGLLLILGAIWLAGATRAARATIAALLLGLLLLQTHAAWRLSFEQGDVARDGLIYNTTTPDVQRMVSDLTQLSYAQTGNLSLDIQYGNDVNWPLYWYLRDFSGAHYGSSVTQGANTSIIILNSSQAQSERPMLSGTYTEQQYVLRWHEPEYSIYRNFAIAPELEPSQSAWGDASNPHNLSAILRSIGSSVMTQTTPEGQQRLWRLIFFREMPAPTMNFTYSIFIRNDLLPTYNAIHYDGQHYTRPNS